VYTKEYLVPGLKMTGETHRTGVSDNWACLFALLALLSGCATGSTVDQIYANPASISFKYTHWYSGEEVYAMQRAEDHCNRYGKHAQLVTDKPSGIDRSTISFNCVAP
jgi:hypothetical protein